MNIVILMAGRGQRFVEKGYKTPKPLIEVKGKTILQWTTESCPYIKHDGSPQDVNLYFAALKEHIDEGLGDFLHSVYGKNINIVSFSEITRGNLDTALICCSSIKNKNDNLLILDSDNKYCGYGLDSFISGLPVDSGTMAIFVFEPAKKQLPNKWSNACIENGVVKGIREKDDEWVDHPALIGIFYFSNTQHFIEVANKTIDEHEPVRGEYYMSMVPSHSVSSVYAHKVTGVVPLGTPEDISMLEKS